MGKKLMVLTLCALAASLLIGTVAQAADPDLMAWWKFDDGQGTTALDSSGYENHGTLENSAWFNDPERGMVMSFNGTDGYVDTDVIIPALTPDNGFSWVFWIKQPASQGVNNDTIMGNRYGGTGSPLQFVKFTPTRFEAYNDDGAYENGINYDPFPSDVWVHNAVVKDGAELTYYRDGVVVLTNTMVKTVDENPFYMGADGFSGAQEAWEGYLSDVRLYTRALAEGEVLAAMAGKGPNAELAGDPVPESEAIDVPRDATLSWTAGDFAATHDVYLGTVFEDVNDASRANGLGVLVSQGQSATSYESADVFELGQTYYWRIDEVNAAPDNAIFKGEVWSFTVEPLAYPIAGVVATSNGTSEEGVGPERTVDGSGLNAAGEHSTAAGDMWLALPGADPLQIQYEFDQVYKLYEMLIWNYNVQFEMILGFGLKDVTVEYSENGTDWTVLGDVEFARATSQVGYAANTTVEFGGVPVKFVRLMVNSGHGTMGKFGLSEVRFMQIPAQAREPQPADGETDVAVGTLLNWRAGREAVSHEVYFGTDPEALTLADTTIDTSYAPGTLDLATTYYWKVDEVNEADAISVWEGSLWSFTTQEFVVIDDFESYDDDKNLIYESWLDGWVNETGSTVGYLEGPFAETTIVNSGSQSMPLFYDNAGVATSEADFELSQDWTASGVKSLSLYFHGAADNTGQLYVKINNTKVAYDGDAADITRAAWQVWNIDLSTVGNVSNVASLTIGVEGAGATGVVYIDDVRLYPLAPEYIVPTEPDSTGLVALYTLDGNANDSSGNGNNGTLNGDVQFGAGVDGSALDCDGVDDYVSTGKSASDLGIAGNSPRTVTVWVYTRSFANGGIYDVGARTTGQDFCLRTYDNIENRWRIQYWGGDFDFTYDTANKWVHFAHVHDGTHTKIYANGVLIVDWAKTIDTTDTNPFQIGCYGWQNDYFDGLIDDLHLYNRALSAEEVLGAAGQTTPRHKPF